MVNFLTRLSNSLTLQSKGARASDSNSEQIDTKRGNPHTLTHDGRHFGSDDLQLKEGNFSGLSAIPAKLCSSKVGDDKHLLLSGLLTPNVDTVPDTGPW